MTRFYLIAATPLLAMLLSACAAPGGPRPQAMATAQQAKPAAPAVAAVELPKQELTRDILFKLLVAEVAGQRGEIGLASEAYADLARNTRDPRVARRATEAAMFAQNGDQALRSSQIWMETDPGDGRPRRPMRRSWCQLASLTAPNRYWRACSPTKAQRLAPPCYRSARC
ncbi:MAG: hypothetical protein EBQ53_02730 [Betaproteobacteria bacterium]|nr:hypothetical protein [Betaproteobacteria bacterium]